MHGYMNAEALKKTIDTGEAFYFSRSRKVLWHKGKSSGLTQIVREIRIDDDQDCVIIEVTLTTPDAGGEEASCHVGYRSCFYREVSGSGSEKPELRFIESEKAFDPDAVYGDTPNPTQL